MKENLTGRRLRIILLFLLAIGTACCFAFDWWLSSGGWRAVVSLPTPVFKENGYAYLAYVPEIDQGPCFCVDTRSSTRSTAPSLFVNGQKLVLVLDDFQSVRQGGSGVWTQIGRLIWLSLPDNGDANAPGVNVEYSAVVKPKSWFRFLFLGLPSCGVLLFLLSPLLGKLVMKARCCPSGARLVDIVARLGAHVWRFLRVEWVVLAGIGTLIAVRAAAFPPLFNFLDTFTMLRAPLSVVGHIPPLYLLLIAALKEQLGLGPALLNSLMIIQYGAFAAALYYLCSAFDTARQKMILLAVVALNFYVLLIAGGLMTESLAVAELFFLVGALVRVARYGKWRFVDALVVCLMSALCLLTRHTFVVFALSFPIMASMYVFADRNAKLVARLKLLLIACAAIGLGVVAGQQISRLSCLALSSDYSVPKGRFGVQAIARYWQSLPEADRDVLLERFSRRSDDPLVRMTFKVLLRLPLSNQNIYDYPAIYDRIRAEAKSVRGADLERALDETQLEEATSSATEIFFFHPDEYSVPRFLELLLDYTQLRELLLRENPVYSLAVIKSVDVTDALGCGWNLPYVRWGYLNRCLFNHAAISEMWCHLCPDTQRVTERIFSPHWKNRVRDSINSRLFWALDFFNPATNFCLLLSGIALGAVSRRLSLKGLMVGTAVLVTTLIYDSLHALSAQETLSRYLAPASIFLALGSAFVWMEIARVWSFAESRVSRSDAGANPVDESPLVAASSR